MELTLFGAMIVAAGTMLVLWRRESVFVLIPIGSVLQAPAAVIVDVGGTRLGITPFLLATGFVALAGLLDIRDHGLATLRRLTSESFSVWVTLLGFTSVGAFVLPHVFEGVGVYPLMRAGDLPVDPVANVFSISHVAQAVNSIVLLSVLAATAISPKPEPTLRWLAAGLLIALLVSGAANVHHRLALLGLFELDIEWWGSNPSYNQHFTSNYGPSYGRASLPFIEPSYASIWFASAAAGCFAVCSTSTSRNMRFSFLLLAFAACGLVLNTVGTSGAAALCCSLPILVAFEWAAQRRAPRASRYPIVATSMVAGVLAAVLAYLDYRVLRLDAMAPVRDAIDFTLLKLAWAPFGPRVWSTQRAFEIAIETWGLGVGPGSTRASSYLVSLLANLGFLGTGLFVLAVVRQLRHLWRIGTGNNPIAAALFGASVACLLGILIAIPDQSWPIAWTLFIAGALAIFSREPQRAPRFAERSGAQSPPA